MFGVHAKFSIAFLKAVRGMTSHQPDGNRTIFMQGDMTAVRRKHSFLAPVRGKINSNMFARIYSLHHYTSHLPDDLHKRHSGA
jgi:hypothetical protein